MWVKFALSTANKVDDVLDTLSLAFFPCIVH